ncbi:uncharacterized protein LOC107980843 [Nasonia vitripennis]|uniref:BED-type domain-containing protein n=1 Tax=Nasonia vitripennis TaxID=7425 RepID=A0A7M7IRV5_NASVI|nr:uncharacterized protein LOC107980843 [Nasonia vitripennis]
MDVSRPKHSEWSRLGFEAKTEYNESGKKVNVAYCLQCEKCLKNTAARRLKSHRNVCKLDINKLKNCVSECVDNDDIQSDHVNLNEESEKHHGVKRKASTRFSDIDMNVINNSTENAKEDKIDKNKMANFFDQINDQESKKIDEALIELFIALDIQFDQVNSRYFKNFIQLLRPAYGLLLPAREKLSGELLSKQWFCSC